jgi:hypothetical protein
LKFFGTSEVVTAVFVFVVVAIVVGIARVMVSFRIEWTVIVVVGVVTIQGQPLDSNSVATTLRSDYGIVTFMVMSLLNITFVYFGKTEVKRAAAFGDGS